LTGQKILLPLDMLAHPGIYVPQTPETAKIVPHNSILCDLIYFSEPARQFAFSEIHQGRFPLWAPYQYGGVPFVWPKFSPFLFLECLVKSPVILAWVQLLAALVAGMGMYFFCRRTLQISFWPATVCAWCYPLTAFFVLWQGFTTGLAVCWLPWLFLAVDRTIHGTHPLAAPGLSVVTFLTLVSGQIDIAGQALLGSGIYAVWCLWDAHPGGWFLRKFWTASVTLILGWGLGFMLAAPHLLPLLEYAQSGSRMAHRSEGAEERPPVGLAALPQVVLPDIYGKPGRGTKKTPVFGMVERGGNIQRRVVANVSGKTLKGAIRECVEKSATIMTDEWPAYRGIGRDFNGGHRFVNHGIKQYADGVVSTNTAESSFAILKRGITGIYHAVSKKHLHRYVGEFDFRWNTRRMNDGDRTVLAVQGANGKRLDYKTFTQQ